MTLRAHKRRVLLLLIEFEVQRAAIVTRGRDVTSIRAAARSHGNLQCFDVERIESGAGHIVTAQAIQIGMLSAFMTKRAGRNSPAPSCQDDRVSNSHRRRQLRIEIDF